MIAPPKEADLSHPKWEEYLKDYTIEGIKRESSVLILRKLAGMAPLVEEWIERNYGGRGRALRERDDPPLEGEPWMSMLEARNLTRMAVLTFILEWEVRQHV